MKIFKIKEKEINIYFLDDKLPFCYNYNILTGFILKEDLESEINLFSEDGTLDKFISNKFGQIDEIFIHTKEDIDKFDYLFKKLNLFNSTSEARRAGWNKEIEKGWNETIKVGKKYKTRWISIFRILTFEEECEMILNKEYGYKLTTRLLVYIMQKIKWGWLSEKIKNYLFI